MRASCWPYRVSVLKSTTTQEIKNAFGSAAARLGAEPNSVATVPAVLIQSKRQASFTHRR